MTTEEISKILKLHKACAAGIHFFMNRKETVDYRL